MSPGWPARLHRSVEPQGGQRINKGAWTKACRKEIGVKTRRRAFLNITLWLSLWLCSLSLLLLLLLPSSLSFSWLWLLWRVPLVVLLLPLSIPMLLAPPVRVMLGLLVQGVSMLPAQEPQLLATGRPLLLPSPPWG